MNLYESCKTPVRVAYLGFVLIAFGFLIKNESVNVFYTFRSGIVLFIAELFLRIGELIIMNLPLVFMLNIVCKKANSASPVVMALVGYFTFVVTTMLFAPQNLSAQAYAGYGINSILNISGNGRSPLETGLIGSLLVAYMTRVSFILSRHRGDFSLANIFSKDTTGLIYNALGCFAIGVLVSYTYPYLYTYLQNSIAFIGEDLSDPMRIGIYSVLDRVLSILNLGNVIRYPFWYTSAGGSFSNTLTGQSVVGDVNIWHYVRETNASYVGAGRFITPFYVINLFLIPAFYIGTLSSMSDKRERRGLTAGFILAILLSIVAGNPLPVELLMLFTSPFLLLIYLFMVGIVSGTLVSFSAFLGFNANGSNPITAMPGSFPDFIINVRNADLTHTLRVILIVGLIAFTVFLFATVFYYRSLSFEFISSQSGEDFINRIIDTVGGLDNITDVGSGLFKLNVYLDDPEKIAIENIHDTGIRRIMETRNGLSFEVGTSASVISARIRRLLHKHRKQKAVS